MDNPEEDFVVRNELDSLGSFDELIHKYTTPGNSVPDRLPVSDFSGLGFLSQHLQSNIQDLRAEREALRQLKEPSNFSGFNLSINQDALKWIVLALFILILIWLVLHYKENKSESRVDRRLSRLEKHIKRIAHRPKPETTE